MANISLKDGQSVTVVGLGTFSKSVTLPGIYEASIVISELPPSGLSVLIQQNGSTKFSFSSPAATQQTINLQGMLNCAANDTIAFVLSSSNVNDEQLNTVKSQILLTGFAVTGFPS